MTSPPGEPTLDEDPVREEADAEDLVAMFRGLSAGELVALTGLAEADKRFGEDVGRERRVTGIPKQEPGKGGS